MNSSSEFWKSCFFLYTEKTLFMVMAFHPPPEQCNVCFDVRLMSELTFLSSSMWSQWSSDIAPATFSTSSTSPTLADATDAAPSFDCKCASYTSRSPLGMAASCGRLHELHGFQRFHQFGALFLHDSSGSGGCIRGYHHLTAVSSTHVCCGVFSVGGLGRGSGLVLIHLTTAVFRLRFHGFFAGQVRCDLDCDNGLCLFSAR